jgi:hypothetical protein
MRLADTLEVPAEGTPATRDEQRAFLIEMYSIDREQNRDSLRFLLGLLTLAFAFLVPVAGYGVGKCTEPQAHIDIMGSGCSPDLAPAVTWFAPFPVLAFLGLLICNQFVLELGGTDLKRLEAAISRLRPPGVGGADHGVLQHARVVTDSAYGGRPSGLLAVIATAAAPIGTVALTIGAILVMPWNGGARVLVTIAMTILYAGVLAVIAWAYWELRTHHNTGIEVARALRDD